MARFTLDTDAQMDKTLADLVSFTGGTKADVIRKALASYRFLKTETVDGTGNKVSITDRDGNVKKDVILP